MPGEGDRPPGRYTPRSVRRRRAGAATPAPGTRRALRRGPSSTRRPRRARARSVPRARRRSTPRRRCRRSLPSRGARRHGREDRAAGRPRRWPASPAAPSRRRARRPALRARSPGATGRSPGTARKRRKRRGRAAGRACVPPDRRSARRWVPRGPLPRPGARGRGRSAGRRFRGTRGTARGTERRRCPGRRAGTRARATSRRGAARRRDASREGTIAVGALRRLGDGQALLVREQLVHQLAELGLQLRLGADLQLTRPLARETEVLAELLQRHRLVVHYPLLAELALAPIAGAPGPQPALLRDVA